MAGCAILYVTDPGRAPFLITYETPSGERQGVLVYAFFANSVVTTNRPTDEHRFQIKYGSNTKATLHLEQDETQLITTLCIGIDLERNLFVGIDPVLHDGTSMFISIEFKRRHAEEIARAGWHAWERASSRNREEPVEVLVGARQDRILDYVCFERMALGLDQGHRQLLAEQMLGANPRKPMPQVTHNLLKELGLPDSELFDLIQGARRLKMAVRGWVAERHLERMLADLPGVDDCQRLDAEGRPDIQLVYRGGRPILIECKNVLRQRAADGSCRVDFQRTRASKQNPCSRYYEATEFSLLAACLHAVTEKWEFRFVETTRLPEHAKCPGRIQSNLRVGKDWLNDPIEALTRVSAT